MHRFFVLIFENILAWGLVTWSFLAKASAVTILILPFFQFVAVCAAIVLSILSIRKLLKSQK